MKRLALLVAASLGLALVVGSAVAIFVGFGTTVGTNVLVNEPQPIDANNSPTVVRNPRRPDNLVVVHRIDSPSFGALLETSFDGGRTWVPRALPLPGGADRPYAPDAAFGPDGTLYVLYANLEGLANAPANLWLARSPDGGRTLAAPVRVAGKLGFQARLAVDHRGTIHLTWLQATGVGLFSLGPGPNPIVAVRSEDGGRTFSSPVPVSDPQRLRVGAASPLIDADGRLHVLYTDFKSDRRDFENLEGPPADEPFALVVTRSDDGGRSFSPGVEAEPEVTATSRFVPFLPPFPSLAAGPAGVLYLAWADGRDGDADIWLRRSGDGGVTWSPPVRVNDERPDQSTAQQLPKVAVAGNGRVDVLFVDRGGDPTGSRANVILATSYDQGRSFGERRLSARSFDARIGPGTPHGDPDLGSRLGLDSQVGGTVAVWTDTRLGTRDTGRQDIAFTEIRRRPVWPILVWPACAALAAGGAMSLVLKRADRPAKSSRTSALLQHGMAD